ncbi:MAG: type II secretion system protein N [Gammaproteobacteria bacterium]
MSFLGGGAANERLLGLAGKAICVLAVAWMAWVLAGIAWLVGGHDGAPLTARSDTTTSVEPALPAVDSSRLPALGLFGQGMVASSGGAVADAPDTSLQLRLTGVFVSADPKRSSAIVAEQNAPAGKLYRVNESLPSGATLESVYEDRILIRRGAGNPEVLRFEKTGLLGGEPSAGLSPRLSAPAVALSSPGPGVRGLLSDAADAMTRSPGRFLREMGLSVSDRGYEVGSDMPEEIRRAVGLEPGDKLMSVNGQSLGNPREDRKILEVLKNGGTARVEVQRGGQIVTVERKF